MTPRVSQRHPNPLETSQSIKKEDIYGRTNSPFGLILS